MDGQTHDIADAVNQMEGYLLWQARVSEAEQRARDFTEPMDWLTTSQRAEIEQRYVSDCLVRARSDIRRVAQRAMSLRGEYEKRYQGLRVRCVALVVLTMTAAVPVTVLAAASVR
ncbi:cytochrome C oxidase subunit I [Streptomyces sp. NPDC090306]|uniref:cytochrome C oxidase subunit I n=1 Tax=unclassified Streptomyces TaxID=2593676 RepID=UPI0036F0F667